MIPLKLSIQNQDDSPECLEVKERIRSFNAAHVGDPKKKGLSLFYKDESGKIRAGIVGNTFWGWLSVDFLWVDDALRGQRIGESLISLAEKEALKRGCSMALVDTFSFQAPGFYKKLGYERFAQLEGFPARDHSRHYFCKKLMEVKVILLPKDEKTIATVANWLYNEFGKTNPNATLEGSIARLRAVPNPDDVMLTLIAVDHDGTPIGTASIIKYDLKSRKDLSPWLGAVYVMPAHRSKGVASLLCKSIEHHLIKLGIQKAFLMTADQQKLYERLGWQVIAVEKHESWKEVTLMEFQISQ